MSNLRTTCGEQQNVQTGSGSAYVAKYLSADGTLDGDTIHVDIYDPAGPGSWEGQLHLYVRLTPPGSDYYTWLTQSSNGISDFGWTSGVNLAVTVPARTADDIQAGGSIPKGPITLAGAISC